MRENKDKPFKFTGADTFYSAPVSSNNIGSFPNHKGKYPPHVLGNPKKEAMWDSYWENLFSWWRDEVIQDMRNKAWEEKHRRG